jgi:hypothetical protein
VDPIDRAFMAVAAAERATSVLESPAEYAERNLQIFGDAGVTLLAAVEAPRVRARTILAYAWLCLEGRMDVRRLAGYVKYGLGHHFDPKTAPAMAEEAARLALLYTIWTASNETHRAQRPPEVSLHGISEASADEVFALSKGALGGKEPFDQPVTNWRDRSAVGLTPITAEPAPLDYDPAAKEQGNFGDPYIDPEWAEVLALHLYLAGAGVIETQDEALWGWVKDTRDKGRPIEGTVTGLVRLGLRVRLKAPEVDVFLPFSWLVSSPGQIARINDPERWIGKADRFTIVRFDRDFGYIAIEPVNPAAWRPLASRVKPKRPSRR